MDVVSGPERPDPNRQPAQREHDHQHPDHCDCECDWIVPQRPGQFCPMRITSFPQGLGT
jgi:hypothetical protein